MPKTRVIVVYGFDKYGITPKTPKPVERGNPRPNLVPYGDELNLEKAEGLIIPQPLFESIQPIRSYFGEAHQVDVDSPRLLACERELKNLLKRGGWVCFLVGRLIERVVQQHTYEELPHTDLLKRFMKFLGIGFKELSGTGTTLCKDDIFKSFIDKYGVSRTSFSTYFAKDQVCHTIAEAARSKVGLAINRKIFILPFQSSNPENIDVIDMACTLANMISNYRTIADKTPPSWADDLMLAKETELLEKRIRLSKEIENVENDIFKLREIRAILTTRDETLRAIVMEALGSFFGLNIDPTDEGREDFKILSGDGNIMAMCEAKGTKKGIQINHITQVASFRERTNYDSKTPCLLIINNAMDKQGIQTRLEAGVSADQLKMAIASNVMILRTIDLLFLMKHLENQTDRASTLVGFIKSGGGWLKADDSGFELIRNSE